MYTVLTVKRLVAFALGLLTLLSGAYLLFALGLDTPTQEVAPAECVVWPVAFFYYEGQGNLQAWMKGGQWICGRDLTVGNYTFPAPGTTPGPLKPLHDFAEQWQIPRQLPTH